MPGQRLQWIATNRKAFFAFSFHLSVYIIVIVLALATLLLFHTENFGSHRWFPFPSTFLFLHQTRGTSKDRRPTPPDQTNDKRKMKEETRVKGTYFVEEKFDVDKDLIAPVPFFWGGGNEGSRGMASHLDHRVEEYRQGLVKVVQVCPCEISYDRTLVQILIGRLFFETTCVVLNSEPL